jgi:hypothetical protein
MQMNSALMKNLQITLHLLEAWGIRKLDWEHGELIIFDRNTLDKKENDMLSEMQISLYQMEVAGIKAEKNWEYGELIVLDREEIHKEETIYERVKKWLLK